MIKHIIVFLLVLLVPAVAQDKPEASARDQLKLFQAVAGNVEILNSQIEKGDDTGPLLNQISSLLKESAQKADTESYREYLLTLSQNILTGDYVSHIPLWMKLPPANTEIFISRNRKSKKLSVYIFRHHIQQTGGIEEILKKLPKLLSLMAFSRTSDRTSRKKIKAGKKKRRRKNKKKKQIKTKTLNPDTGIQIHYDQIKPLIITDLIYPRKSKAHSLVIPRKEEENPDREYKIFILKNSIKRHFQKRIKPAADEKLSPELRKDVTFSALITNIMMHRISHYLSPIYISGGDTLVSEALGKTYYTIEEIRADMAALRSIKILEEEKLAVNPTANVLTHIMTMVEKVTENQEKYIAHPYMIQLNYFLKRGSITRDKSSNRLAVNIEKLETDIGELLSETTLIQQQGKLALASEFIRQYRFGPDQ